MEVKRVFILDLLGNINIGLPAALCFAVGFIFVVIEMFHPGFSAPGITGTILLILGVVITARDFTQALIMIIIILAILGILMALVLQSATKGRLSKIIVLKESQNKESGYIGTEDLEYFLGKEGITVTVLRPSGTADFDGVKMDVVSQGDFIQKDSKVRIIKVEGRRIVVKQIEKK
jgi:membrane-bound ClpP family serine protease